jgi:hypothetical protein
MGNGQSVQAPRRGKNKLSKPKTKPSAVPSSTSNTPNASRRNSVIGKGAVTSSTTTPYGKHLSIPESAPLETVLSSPSPAPTPSKKKRMRIFRLRSSKKEKDILYSDAIADHVPSNTAPIVTGRFASRTNSINSTAVEVPLDKPWAPTPSSRYVTVWVEASQADKKNIDLLAIAHETPSLMFLMPLALIAIAFPLSQKRFLQNQTRYTSRRAWLDSMGI